jgi:hypothetical protein
MLARTQPLELSFGEAVRTDWTLALSDSRGQYPSSPVCDRDVIVASIPSKYGVRVRISPVALIRALYRIQIDPIRQLRGFDYLMRD